MQTQLIVIIALLWAGMVLGISFLESWVKFRAPSLTKPVGLDVGRTVFGFFNKVQGVIFLLIIILCFTVQLSLNKWLLIIGLGLILCLQFFWLFPQLNNRVNMILAGEQPKRSHVHTSYAILEIIKLLLLLILAITLMSPQHLFSLLPT